MATDTPNALDFEVPVEGTDTSIGIARADQGTRIVQVAFANPGLGINVFEGERGDDLDGFRERWTEWVESEEPTFPYQDARFGMTAYLCRGAIPLVVAFSLQYQRREDTRAPFARRGVPVDEAGLPVLRRR